MAVGQAFWGYFGLKSRGRLKGDRILSAKKADHSARALTLVGNQDKI